MWAFDLGGGGWGCGQDQTYTSDERNVRASDGGILTITARRGPDSRITSARLHTKGCVEIRYGLMEACLRVPGGAGTWPAFWMLGSDIDQVGWPACGEIDVMEQVGSQPSTVHGTLHAPGFAGLRGGLTRAYDVGEDLSRDFHVYAVDWRPGRITWLVDGHAYHRLTPDDVPLGTWPFDKPFFLLLNLAINGDWPGNRCAVPALPAEFEAERIQITSHHADRSTDATQATPPGGAHDLEELEDR